MRRTPRHALDVRAATRAGGATRPLEGLLAGLRLALGTGNAGEHRAALSGVTDWPAVAGLAARHRVGAQFLQGLGAGGVRIPDPAAERALAERRKRDTLRGMRQLDAMGRVTAALAARSIPSLLLKGLPLGQRLYGSPFAKSSIDIDLLVPRGAFAAAGRVLHELGCRRATAAFRETRAHVRWYDAVRKDRVYSCSGSKIELHRRLLDNPFLFDPPFDDLDAGALTVEIGSAAFRTLGDPDQLLYLACHGSVHSWQRLKWLCDAAALLRAMDGASAAQAVARGREEQLEQVLAPTLRLCREALLVELPESVGALRQDSPQVRFVVDLSRYAWTAPEGLRQLMWKAAMRVGRLFLRGGVRFSLLVRGLPVRRHDFPGVDPPGRFFWLGALTRPLIRALHRLRKAA